MRVYRSVLVTLLVIVFCFPAYVAQTQNETELPTTLTGCKDQERVLLRELNGYRTSLNIVPFITSPVLCKIAYDQAVYVSNLSGNSALTSRNEVRLIDGEQTYVVDWAREAGYPAYRGNTPNVQLKYFVSLLAPEAVISNLKNQWRDLINSTQFREVGLGYIYNSVIGYHIYILVVGSRPNVLPAMIVDENRQPMSMDTIPIIYTNQLLIGLNNEFFNFNPDDPSDYLRQVVSINVSEIPPRRELGEIDSENPVLMDCTLTEDEKQPFNLFFTPLVSDGVGLKTFYIRMCDKSNRMLITQVSVSVIGTLATNTPPPTEGIEPPSATVDAPSAPSPSATVDEIQVAMAATQTRVSVMTTDLLATQAALEATQAAQQSANITSIAETNVAVAQQMDMTLEAMQTQIAETSLSLTPPAAMPTATDSPTLTPIVPPSATETASPTDTATLPPTSVTVTPLPFPLTATLITPISIGTPQTPLPTVEHPWLELVWDDDRMIIKNVSDEQFNPIMVSFLTTDLARKYLDFGAEPYDFELIMPDSCIQVYNLINDSSIDSFFSQQRGFEFECNNKEKLETSGVELMSGFPWVQDFVVRYKDSNLEEDFVCYAANQRCIVPYPGSN